MRILILHIKGDSCNIVVFTKSQLFNEVLMPNWTYNRVRVRGDDSEKIKEIKELFKSENPFNVLIPEPDWTVTPLTKEYAKAYAFSDPRGNIGELPVPPDPDKAYSCLTFASTGRQDDRWYDWRCTNWGTKWGACEIEINQDDEDFLEITFNTAWSPPEPIVNELRSRYECKDGDSYCNGKYISVSWLYELEGDEGVGYL